MDLLDQIVERKADIKRLASMGNTLANIIVRTLKTDALNVAPLYIKWCLDNMENWDD